MSELDTNESQPGENMIDPEHYLKGEARFSKRYVSELRKISIVPGLAIVTIGNSQKAADHAHKIEAMCGEVDAFVKHVALADGTSVRRILDEITKLNDDKTIHGIMVLDPIPESYSPDNIQKIRNAIHVTKDIDVSSDAAVGCISNAEEMLGVSMPSLAWIMVMLIAKTNEDLEGKKAVILQPAAYHDRMGVSLSIQRSLLEDGCCVSICTNYDTPVDTFDACLADADVVISMMNHPGYITGDKVKPGAIIIDAGDTHTDDGEIVGDVDVESVKQVAGHMLYDTLCNSNVVIARMLNKLCYFARTYGYKRFSQQLTPLDLQQIDEALEEPEDSEEEEQQPGNTELC